MYLKKEIMNDRQTSVNIFHTVKFKIALSFIFLFIFSAVVLYGTIFYFLKKNITTRRNEELTGLVEELESIYSRGRRPEYEDEFPNCKTLKSTPDKVISSVKKKLPDIYIREIELKNENGIDLYEVRGNTRTRIYELDVTPDGKITNVEFKSSENGIKFVEEEFMNETRYEGAARLYFALYSPDGKLLAKSDMSDWPSFKLDISQLLQNRFDISYRTVTADNKKTEIRVVDKRLFDGNILEAGINLDSDKEFIDLYTSIFWSVTGCMLLVCSIVAWLIAGKAMNGVTRVTKVAQEIGKGDISLRVPLGNEGAEIANLVYAFNNMLARIETLITDLREVSDNIAHDLRTPLTRIRGIIETTSNGTPSVKDYREMTADIIEECDKLIEIVNTMLEITKIDAGVEKLSISKVNINKLLKNAYELFQPLAENKNIYFRLLLPEKDIFIQADESRLQRVMANLIDNAVKYTPDNGTISITAELEQNNLTISVTDTGSGISQKEADRIFERFYRCDASRTVEGNGLGLSLAKVIVEAHGGKIIVKTSHGAGSTFIVKLQSASVHQ